MFSLQTLDYNNEGAFLVHLLTAQKEEAALCFLNE
jgi:hypothetical protein